MMDAGRQYAYSYGGGQFHSDLLGWLIIVGFCAAVTVLAMYIARKMHR